MAHHIQTFPDTQAFVNAYNSGDFAVPYVGVIESIIDKDTNKPLVLYSNRLPYKENGIAAPRYLSAQMVCGRGVIGASTLGK